MSRRKVIIDTDCGGDDAVGILVAAADPNVDLVALTACWGNVNVDQGIENLGKLVDVIDKDIPIYRGAAGPLLGQKRETSQWYGYGTDGFGDADFVPSKRAQEARQGKHAALALVDILSQIRDDDPDVWQLVTLGPLTNVAIALSLCPQLFKKLGRPGASPRNETAGKDAGSHKDGGIPGVVMMGGASRAMGNAGLMAEFNFGSDPEAARAVFNNTSARMPLCCVTWELTVDMAVPWELFDKLIGRASSMSASASAFPEPTSPADGQLAALLDAVPRNPKMEVFFKKLLRKFEETSRPAELDTGEHPTTQTTAVICDATAVSIAVADPAEMVLEQTRTYATIELHGAETRGGLCIDWYGTPQSMATRDRWVNADIPTKAHLFKYLEALVQIPKSLK